MLVLGRSAKGLFFGGVGLEAHLCEPSMKKIDAAPDTCLAIFGELGGTISNITLKDILEYTKSMIGKARICICATYRRNKLWMIDCIIASFVSILETIRIRDGDKPTLLRAWVSTPWNLSRVSDDRIRTVAPPTNSPPPTGSL